MQWSEVKFSTTVIPKKKKNSNNDRWYFIYRAAYALSLELPSPITISARTMTKPELYTADLQARQLAVPQHRCKRSSSWISTASEQHKDSCVCGAVGARTALEALRLYLGCVRLCALQIDIYLFTYLRLSSVYRYFWDYPFLYFSFFLFSTVLVVGSVW